ncbi:hypothetical protein [Desulfosporosinus sp. FKB]|uniref:hypothetical protein n=1 Tax=Desulfosporosinus sp. FKB TaxID=1969835 RepID=UPI000B49DA0E|nr:hypothetical protein [Desulfosporosinus sp. FKB]
MSNINNKRLAWVIKDSQGNFCHANSIVKWNKTAWIYASYKEFSQECRGYLNLQQAKQYLDELKSKAKEIGLDESFHLDYVDLNKLVRQYIVSDEKAENIILVEKVKKQVA